MCKIKVLQGALLASLLIAAGFVLRADSGGAGTSGTDVGYAGVNGEQGSCAACHTSGSGSGSVNLTFPAGPFYVPGTKQHLVVTIADTPQVGWGFQLTARQASSLGTMAGSFVVTDANTQNVCGTTDFKKEQFFVSSCPSSMPLMYIEHSFIGTRLPNGGQARSATFEFDWNPPSTDIGPIQISLSAVAANGDGTTSGDHVYNTRYTVTRLQPNQPLISNGGIVNGASFQSGSTVSPGSWVTITGTNLANNARPWASGDFSGSKLPTSLDGVSVTMDGKPAYVEYISANQVNVLAPAGTAIGNIQVAVTNNGMLSNTQTVTMANTAPALFLWNSKYAVATRTDFSLAAPAGLFSGATTVPAKPGETIILWCTGLGTTTPALTPGSLTPSDQIYSALRTPLVTIGGVGANVIGAALAPGYAGLYQVSIQVPSSLGDGDQPIVLQSGTTFSPMSGVYLTIQH